MRMEGRRRVAVKIRVPCCVPKYGRAPIKDLYSGDRRIAMDTHVHFRSKGPLGSSILA